MIVEIEIFDTSVTPYFLNGEEQAPVAAVHDALQRALDVNDDGQCDALDWLMKNVVSINSVSAG